MVNFATLGKVFLKALVTIIKKGTPKTEIKRRMDEVIARGRKSNILKYAGILKTDIEPITYQNDVRNEWK